MVFPTLFYIQSIIEISCTTFTRPIVIVNVPHHKRSVFVHATRNVKTKIKNMDTT